MSDMKNNNENVIGTEATYMASSFTMLGSFKYMRYRN